MTHRGVAAAAVALLVAVTSVVACGVPTGEDSLERLEPDADGFGLDAPSTTLAPTTTTTVAPTLVPATTAAPTTTMPPAVVSATIYFISRDRLREVVRPLPFAEILPDDLITPLEDGPTDLESPAVDDSAVEAGLIQSVDIAGGVATIDLDERLFDRVFIREQRFMFGQIALTFINNLQPVGLVRFTVDGEPQAVRNGSNFLTSEPVSVDDYTNLLADAPSTPSTSPTTSVVVPTTTSVATTTDPADSTENDDETPDEGPTSTAEVTDEAE